MNRRIFISTTAAAAALPLAARDLAQPSDWPSDDHVRAKFKETMEFFRKALPEHLSKTPLIIEKSDEIERREADELNPDHIQVLSPLVQGEPYGIIKVARNGDIMDAGAGIHNTKPRKVYVPQWSMHNAIERAGSWLKNIGWEIPAEFQVGEATYLNDGSWYVMWHRLYAGVPEAQTGSQSDEILVIMEEAGTGLRLGRRIRGDAPATTVPKLSRTAAVTLAAQALPQIMATQAYQSWMPAGLSPTNLRKAELCVAKPNWLLDPKRYKLAGPNMNPERRLCWHMVFMLRGAGKVSGPEAKSEYGLVYVLIDAVTGETVGADMEPIGDDGLSRRFGNK